MVDQYGAGDGAAFPLVLVGTFAGAGFIMGDCYLNFWTSTRMGVCNI
jgi:hypothetical protein